MQNGIGLWQNFYVIPLPPPPPNKQNSMCGRFRIEWGFWQKDVLDFGKWARTLSFFWWWFFFFFFFLVSRMGYGCVLWPETWASMLCVVWLNSKILSGTRKFLKLAFFLHLFRNCTISSPHQENVCTTFEQRGSQKQPALLLQKFNQPSHMIRDDVINSSVVVLKTAVSRYVYSSLSDTILSKQKVWQTPSEHRSQKCNHCINKLEMLVGIAWRLVHVRHVQSQGYKCGEKEGEILPTKFKSCHVLSCWCQSLFWLTDLTYFTTFPPVFFSKLQTQGSKLNWRWGIIKTSTSVILPP